MVCPKQKLQNNRVISLKLKVISFCFFVCLAISLSAAEELEHTKVIGNNVNVRVRPDANSEIVTQLRQGENVIVLEKQDEWTKIIGPSHSKCWVFKDGVNDSVIIKDSVNMRCGPGAAYPVLARLKKGTNVQVLETFGDWVKIDPPVEFGVWISSKYLECNMPVKETEKEKKEIIKPVVEEPPSNKDSEGLQPSSADVPIGEPQISVSQEEISGIELVSFAGRLEDLGIIINRPGTYKLISGSGKWECIIRSPTLDVNPYINRIVRVEGVALAKTSSWNVPVIELKKLNVIK